MLDIQSWPGNINSVGGMWGENKQGCLIYLLLHSPLSSFILAFCLTYTKRCVVVGGWRYIFTKHTFFSASSGNQITLKFLESLRDHIQMSDFK